MAKAFRRLEELGDVTALENASNFHIGDPVSHDQVVELSNALKSYNDVRGGVDDIQYHLDALLKGSRVYISPKPPSKEKTPEYQALMDRLRREEEERLYMGMVQPRVLVNNPLESAAIARQNLRQRATEAEDPDEMTFADVNRQVALIINVLVSIIACGIAIWLVSSHWSAPKRLALSMSGSGMVGIAEVVIYAGYIRRLKLARDTERSKPERKTIEESWVIEPSRTPLEPVRISTPGEAETSGLRRRGRDGVCTSTGTKLVAARAAKS